MLRSSHTAVVERNIWWEGEWSTEPYEAAWATRAVAFVRVLERRNIAVDATLRVQISPDGIHWCDEGNVLNVSADQDISFARVSQFGGWLRLTGVLAPEQGLKVVVYLALQG